MEGTRPLATETASKLTKFSTPFSIESLIANHQQHQQQQQQQQQELERSTQTLPPTSNREQDELNARALVATSALGLANFPFYNPWLHGYFAQNHDRLTQLISSGCYLTNCAKAEQNLSSAPSPLPPQLASKNTTTLPPAQPHLLAPGTNFTGNADHARSLPSVSTHTLEPQMATRFLFNPTDANYRDKLLLNSFGSGLVAGEHAPLTNMAPACLANDSTVDQQRSTMEFVGDDYVHNLTVHTRLHSPQSSKASAVPCEQTTNDISLVASSASSCANTNSRDSLKSHTSEALLDVGMDEDFDCSGDSCSDISLTMSPKNYSTDMDKSRGTYKYISIFILIIN